MKTPYLFLLFNAVLFLNGCTQSPAPETLNRSDLPGKKIAVIPFDHDSADLTGKLAQQVDGKADFVVINSAEVTSLMNEHSIKTSARMDDADAVKLGQLTGVKAVVSGAVDAPTLYDDHYYVERTKCQKEQCWRVKVACMKRTVGLTVEINMINVSTANIVYTEKVHQEKSWSRCADDTKTVPSKYTGVQQLADTIAESFADKLTQPPLESRF